MGNVDTSRSCCLCGHVGYIKEVKRKTPIIVVLQCSNPKCGNRWKTMLLLTRTKAVG